MSTTMNEPLVLERSPSLLPLYAKAALTGALHRGDSLSDSRYVLRDQPIDRDRLAAYQQVCGFRASDVLPPTFLHVLAFPVTVALMTEPDFPFPLIGLVHVANAISVVRPVRADERVSFDVHAADLRPHPAGRQLDLLVQASVDGEIVWTGRSTYLRRASDPPERADRDPRSGRTESEPLRALAAHVRVPDDIGRRYAAVSGDRNPIHMSAVGAKLLGFRSAIAHGMWLKARTLATLEGRLPEACTVDVRFKTPVFLPTTIAIGSARKEQAWTLDVRGARSGKPHLTGTVSG